MTKITLTSHVIFCDRKHLKCEAADKSDNAVTFTKVCFLVLDSGNAFFPSHCSAEGRNKLQCTLGLAVKCLCTLPLSRNAMMSKSKLACWGTRDWWDRLVLKSIRPAASG